MYTLTFLMVYRILSHVISSMSEQSNRNQAVEAWRARHEAFVNARHPRDHSLEIDVDDLVGAKGERLEPIAEDWLYEFSSDPASPHYETPNMVLVGNAEEFPEIPFYRDNPEEQTWAMATEQILGRLASRKVAVAIEPLKMAVNGLREPVRTVAINCLYLGASSEDAARCFGTSVETIEFLTDIALDQLAAHVNVS